MVAQSENFIGLGLYSLREAAFYARIPTQTMARWLFPSKNSEAAIERQIKSDEKLVTFLDFVQAMAVRSVRVERKIPLAKIRQAIRLAEREYKVSFPFARRHTTFLVGSEITIKLGDDEYVEVSGRHARNRSLTKVVETYKIDLGFDAKGLANRYRAFQWGNYSVSMDPHVRFGEPLVPSGYTAQALWEAVKAEGGIENAAQAYGVNPEEIELATRYFDHLQVSLAA